MRPARLLGVLLAVHLVVGCDFTQVRQSSLVPVAAMPPPVSQRGRVDVYAGDSLVTVLGTRDLRPNENAGLWLPRHQLDGSIGWRMSRYFGMRLLGGAGLPQDATPATVVDLPRPRRATGWGGIGVYFNYLDASGFGVDLEVDTSLAFIPSRISSRHCGWVDEGWGGHHECGEWSPWRNAMDVVPMFAGTARGIYAPAEWITMYVGATVRNHPTNDGVFSVDGASAESSVSMGGPALVVGAGAELTIEDVFSVIPHVTWTVWGGPVNYGPMLGLAVRGRFEEGPGDALPPWPPEDASKEP